MLQLNDPENSFPDLKNSLDRGISCLTLAAKCIHVIIHISTPHLSIMQITRRLEFDAGHRIPVTPVSAATCTATAISLKSPCPEILSPPKVLSEQGMVMDYSRSKAHRQGNSW